MAGCDEPDRRPRALDVRDVLRTAARRECRQSVIEAPCNQSNDEERRTAAQHDRYLARSVTPPIFSRCRNTSAKTRRTLANIRSRHHRRPCRRNDRRHDEMRRRRRHGRMTTARGLDAKTLHVEVARALAQSGL
jgi:hypothetical protein